MPVSSAERILDVGIPDLNQKSSIVLYSGMPGERVLIEEGSDEEKRYRAAGKVLRWYFGLMGETSPETSPLSVDVAGDKNYLVYRYDWVFGVAIPNVTPKDRDKDPNQERQGALWWNWQAALTDGTCMAVQVMISREDHGVGYSCVSTNLNVLPPSRDTTSWWQRNRKGVIEFVKSGATAAEQLHPGIITKTFSALSNSLDSKEKWSWKRTNWFIYQYVDPDSQSCAVEWRIYKKVLRQYGPLLRGSLILAFHGEPRSPGHKGITLTLRPQLGFIAQDEFKRITPTEHEDQSKQVQLNILPALTSVNRK